nr:RNA-directed DNA polymerase, eukaryota, reverse transcriptase zinc-binding domain protein [Tanacetum cinerariifolium]
LLDYVILSNSNDRWVSDLNGDGVFRVNDVRNLLDEFFLPRADVPTRNGGIFVAFILYRYLRHRLKPFKVLPYGEVSGATLGLLSPSMMQVTEHHKLLGEKIMYLSGEASMVRLQNALSETQRQYSKSKEKSSFVEPPVTHIVPSNYGPNGKSDNVGQLPFLDHDSMSLLEDTAGSKNRPPMLNKENYVTWSSRLLGYAKSRPNGKLIYNSIMNGSYVKRMIPEPGDVDREVPINPTFHEQSDDELTKKELKQIEADDQAIQTILLDLPKDIYAAVDSCETAQEI